MTMNFCVSARIIAALTALPDLLVLGDGNVLVVADCKLVIEEGSSHRFSAHQSIAEIVPPRLSIRAGDREQRHEAAALIRARSRQHEALARQRLRRAR